MNKKRPTIQDVANLAGVGKTSVSRYLNHEFQRMSTEMKRKISFAIKELDYKPSQLARSMKKGKTKLIALILADIRNPYSVDLLQGVEQACLDNNYTLLLFNTNNRIEQEKKILQSLLSYQVEGIISQAVINHDENFKRYPLPMVSIDRGVDGVDCDIVSLDNKQSAKLIVNHLLEKKIQAILFITGKIADIPPREQRVQKVRSMLNAYSNCIYETVELEDIEDADTIDDAISRFYSEQRAVKKAIISVNGITTLNIALSFKRLNLECGKDIALIGFDDPVWLPVTFNGISSIRQPMFEMGYTALELLLKRINGDQNPTKTLLYPGELIIRHSTQI